jgi:hypothetical protein
LRSVAISGPAFVAAGADFVSNVLFETSVLGSGVGCPSKVAVVKTPSAVINLIAAMLKM